ncbi:hypothetical protein ABIB99_008465 [Bradyrhizobium sp. LA6.1]|uniref:hypothetical protein n=1 Tax=Bradyrhizobium sp. LA6.1 TaxID=3156378 RepID=UPI003392F456
MTKPNPAVRYFVGKFDNDKRGIHHRVMRRTTKALAFHSFHVYDRGEWKKTREAYKKASNLVPTREQA